MAIAGETPYAWETKEGELKYSHEELVDYNKRYNNQIGDEQGLYTANQVREILIKFSSKIEAVDEMEPPFIPDVDDFMKSQEEE